MKIKRLTASLVLVIALLTLPAAVCSTATIENALTKAAVGSATARQVVTIQHQFGRIDDTHYKTDLLAFKAFNTDLDKLGDDLVSFGTVTPENKTQILDRIDKLIVDVDSLGAQGLGFKSAEAQAAFSAGIKALRAGLQTARNIINAVKKPTPVSAALVDRINELRFTEVSDAD